MLPTGCVRFIVFQNKNTKVLLQICCTVSFWLLSPPLNATFIGIFCFKQISSYRKAMNAKWVIFRVYFFYPFSERLNVCLRVALILDIRSLGVSIFIISILKSLVILAIWLALSSVIYSRLTLFFAINHVCCKSRHSYSKSRHFCSKSHHFRSISHHFCDVKAFLFPLFDKPATWSIKYWCCLNSAISKWL